MAELLQVAAPVMPKNYNLTAKPIVQTDEIFDLVDLSKVIKTADRTEQFMQQDAAFDENLNLIPKLPMLIAKDPSLTANSLKSLLSSDVINQLTENGNVELLNKLNELAGEVVLSPGDLLSDMKTQQKATTIFNGDFFNLLRGLSAQTTNADVKTAIVNLLKATVNAASEKDVLNSLSSNLKFLAEQLSPSKALSSTLRSLSDQLKAPNAGENFTLLKSQILSVLHEVNSSLLLTDKTKNLLPLITHNLSRYNDSSTAMKDGLSNLVDLLSNKDLKAALTKTFNDYIESTSLPQDIKLQTLSADADLTKLASEGAMQKLTTDLAEQANSTSKLINVDMVKVELGNISTQNGVSSLKEILMLVLPQSSEEMLNKFLGEFEQTRDLNALLGKLSTFLNSIDRMEVKVVLAQTLNEALGNLAKSENTSYNPPSSMENLVDFLSKNINDSALRSLNTFNQNEMIQSLLTAPGVFTPLLHYLIPVQIEETRAFGELWVDNDAGKSSGAEDDSNHLFLSFSVENIGDFELEIYTKSTDISVTLMCPKNLTKSFSKIKDSIVKIASSNGFTAKTTIIDSLKDKRNLVEVFTRIREKRVGLNVTV